MKKAIKSGHIIRNRIIRLFLIYKARYQSKRAIAKNITNLMEGLLFELGHKEEDPGIQIEYGSKIDIREQIYRRYVPVLIKVAFENKNEGESLIASIKLGRRGGCEIRDKLFTPYQFVDVIRLAQSMDNSLGTKVTYFDSGTTLFERKKKCVLKKVYIDSLTEIYPTKIKKHKNPINPPCAWVCDRFIEGFFTGLLDSKTGATVYHLPLEKGLVCHRKIECSELGKLKRTNTQKEWAPRAR